MAAAVGAMHIGVQNIRLLSKYLEDINLRRPVAIGDVAQDVVLDLQVLRLGLVHSAEHRMSIQPVEDRIGGSCDRSRGYFNRGLTHCFFS